ncbi:MAG: right-handed parallel beta-helix repeat-containing protein [Candidatus Hydrogenedentes bacterium]|nr:right-handed parallel beta-helix repeat-containing protein [Candidatus Hydrogenedentota bacterium]
MAGMKAFDPVGMIAVCSCIAILVAVAGRAWAQAPEAPGRVEIRVGIDDGDLRGGDHRALQAAVDYVAGLGGGTVRIGPGRYVMRNALFLRDNVRVVGTPGETVLAVADAASSALAVDGDCNELQITLADPSGFRVGDGVAVRDKRFGGGFCVTTATLTEQLEPATFRISTPLYLDYYVSKEGTAQRIFPAVAGLEIGNAAVEGLTIEGNGEHSFWLDGCRGGGIFLFKCADVHIRGCTVRDYNGDGISFQVSSDVIVEDCLAEHNMGYGLHPGSGSQRPVMRSNRSLNNGSDGMYVCWRVRHGLFEGNELRGNGRVGISIGHKDSDNEFRENLIAESAQAGVLFRREDEPMGAHRNVFEHNRIVDNGLAGGVRACVVVEGHHLGVAFRHNEIGNSKPGAPTQLGIFVGADAGGFIAEGNTFTHVEQEMESEQGG